VTDDDLDVLLRRADPAAGLAALAPDRVTHLLEGTMSVDTETTSETHAPISVRRGPHRWLLAAAAAAVALAGAGIFAFGGDSGPGSGPADSGRSAAIRTVTRLTASGVARKCPAPTAERLAEAQVAFEGTVRSIAGGVVTFAPTRFDAGPKTDTVEVRQLDGASERLLGGSTFEVGQTYLVAGADGEVFGCGYSGIATPQLQALYAEAF
jgi:hypothetical protein